MRIKKKTLLLFAEERRLTVTNGPIKQILFYEHLLPLELTAQAHFMFWLFVNMNQFYQIQITLNRPMANGHGKMFIHLIGTVLYIYSSVIPV